MCVTTPVTGTVVTLFVRFVKDSHYAAFRKHGQAFLPKFFIPARKILFESDPRELALAYLCDDRCAFFESKRSVTDLFAI